MRQSLYTDTIRTVLAQTGHIGVDPRHVEGYMRLEHPTLDSLPPWKFTEEVKVAVDCIALEGAETAERLAKSYGL